MEQRIKENGRKLEILDEFIKYMEKNYDIKLLQYQKMALRLLTIGDLNLTKQQHDRISYSLGTICKNNKRVGLVKEHDEFLLKKEN